MTAVMSIVATGSGAQIVFGLAVAMVFMKLYAYCLPFKEFDNNVLQEVLNTVSYHSLLINCAPSPLPSSIISSNTPSSPLIPHLLLLSDISSLIYHISYTIPHTHTHTLYPLLP